MGEEGGLFFNELVIHEHEGLGGNSAFESHGATVGGGGCVEEFHAGHKELALDVDVNAAPPLLGAFVFQQRPFVALTGGQKVLLGNCF